MTKKYLLVIACVLFFSVAGYLLWQARTAKKESNNILQKFRAIDSSLNNPVDSIQNKKEGTGAFK